VQYTSECIANMPYQYLNKYTDIHIIYSFCNSNSTAAVAEYQQSFLQERRIPCKRTSVMEHFQQLEDQIIPK